jgi:hypothetical protein
MTADVEALRRRARRKAREAAVARRDRRFLAVMGRLVSAGLLETNIEGVRPHRRTIRVADALWAGQWEPRVLELLPALVIKKPGLFRDPQNMPEDLADVVQALREGREVPAFRGIPAQDLQRWVPLLGHRGKQPSVVKSFRLRASEVKLLADLRAELGLGSEVEVIRAALRALRRQSSQP